MTKSQTQKTITAPPVNKNVPSEQKIGFFEYFQFSESYTSLLLGIIAVIVASTLIISFIRQHNFATLRHMRQQISATQTGPVTSTKNGTQKLYTIASGDDLWDIAIKEYNDGYKWTVIANANNLTNPDIIYAGNYLVIPANTEIAQIQTTSTTSVLKTAATTVTTNAPLPATYTVQKGDTLWAIAVKLYDNGYRWTAIAQANDLINPDMIFSGNVFTLPAK